MSKQQNVYELCQSSKFTIKRSTICGDSIVHANQATCDYCGNIKAHVPLPKPTTPSELPSPGPKLPSSRSVKYLLDRIEYNKTPSAESLRGLKTSGFSVEHSKFPLLPMLR
mmetsp:Transcript_116875/g.202867  ORF Transcript_116875/g.202867 Transcript_116875/m.202867 type:complete len:111 (+) Transcript_116875:155-487(+)